MGLEKGLLACAAQSVCPSQPTCTETSFVRHTLGRTGWADHSPHSPTNTPRPSHPDELVQEILARLPPEDPACLLRAFLVCKAWGCAVSLPSFRRRLHELHRASPLLGFLPNRATQSTPSFIPTTASSFSLDAPDCLEWRALDCRHGRAVFLSVDVDVHTLLVWEPITGAQKLLPVPASFDNVYADFPSDSPTAAVLCAADGCDHRDCLGGPFRVVFIFEEQCVTSACVFSSETGAWGELTSLHSEFFMEVQENSSVLVGSSLLYFRARANASVLEYDLARHALTVFSPPDNCDCDYFNLMLTEEGRLGVIQDLDSHLKLWTRENASDGTDARWVLSRVIYLRNLFPANARVNVMGFAEGAIVFFVNSVAGVFTVELQSEEYLLVPKPSEEADGEEGREGEKTMDQAQHLFDKGSNATNEGDFVNTFECISLDHDIGVLRYGEVALRCASRLDKYGCAYEAQE